MKTNPDRDTLRDRIADAVFPLLLDTLPKVIARSRGYEVADAVLAVLPEPTDRAAVLREAADHLATLRPCDDCDPGRHDAIERLRRLAAEASTTKSEVEPCAHCGKTIRLVTGTLAQWWVHEPGGHTICFPEQAASSPRATPRPAAGVRQDGAQP